MSEAVLTLKGLAKVRASERSDGGACHVLCVSRSHAEIEDDAMLAP